ncbi:probable ATP-dependent RNA helicase DDX10 isoform X2 [Cotesia glomerata]|uniref:ATP-dependent RNA helicase n=1 Tax=Cotesia glomerata TaxID=32391 RepID=A0AAV7IDW5_COTGL|nr:probable ATP-dependent RNA helicase DDX10 isoform X2 [Cotesia glomerata]KAH0549911.1 hypothetical protein KQX54_015851 [Cotesia glomerata]
MANVSHKSKKKGENSNNQRRKFKTATRKKTIPQSKKVEILKSKYKEIDESKIKKFSDFPLSEKTLKGLKESKYFVPSEIQRQCIGKALQGYDILGAAKTGSGKTLAFLIPVLELLYCELWSREDRLGAMIITPTRELALQIFETLRSIGRHHDFSAALIIGGKDWKFERNRMETCNIVIGTPGRILQHLDENASFDTNPLKILVLDEADRCLDQGFQNDIDAIMDHLPKKKQTLLFSATQTKSVKDLARLNLSKDRQYISVHEHMKYVTPDNLKQSYTVCNLDNKVAMLWSFLKRHTQQKIIVFFSTCKQTKYMFECFCKLRPGIPITALYGTMHQLRRMKIYEKFCTTNKAALFCTDIASRGLDFPGVNWVVQMDCPEDTDQYIHRAGRTARFEDDGQSLLVLTPNEIKMIDKLVARKIPINKVKIDDKYIISPHRQLEAFLARDVELKQSAKRAFLSYIKSVALMKDKEIFDVHSLNTDAYAASLGLAIPPRVRFLQRHKNNLEKQNKSNEKENELLGDEESDQDSEEDDHERKEKHKEDDGSDNDDDDNNENEDEDEEIQKNTHEKKNSSIKNDGFKNAFGTNEFANDDSGDDLLTIKRKNVQIEDGDADEFAEDFPQKTSKKIITKAAAAKKILHKKLIPNKKITFDEEGKEVLDSAKSQVSQLAREHENYEPSGIDIELSKKILREEDKIDKQRFQEKIKAKRREAKRKLKAQMNKDNDEDDDDDDEYVTLPRGKKGKSRVVKLASASEDENDSDGPDLSWIPDPDKIYGPKKDTSNDEDSESDQAINRPSKRKLPNQDNLRETQPKLKVPKNSDLLATEELALQLLNN